MSRFLITGVGGFIGSSLAHACVQAGDFVRGVDDFSNGSLRNLDGIVKHIDLRRVDIRDSAAMHSACQGIDYVLHHAAIVSVPQSIEDPLRTHDVNVTGTLNVLLAARDAGVRRVILAASSAAYGNGGRAPRREDMMPCPLSPYAIHKLAGEAYVRNFSELFDLEGVCLRYFNVFGPRQSANSPYSGVIAAFIRKMMMGQRPTIFGSGEQSRDFTFIDNVVQANLMACIAPAEEVNGRVFNIGTGSSQNLNELFNALSKLLPFSGEPLYAPARSGDVLYSEADITQARRSLRYAPVTGFQAGLQRTVEWYLGDDKLRSLPLADHGQKQLLQA